MPLGRSWSLIARNVFDGANWRAFARAPAVYVHPVESMRRYLTAAGQYPWRCELRTPRGRLAPELSSYHDLVTVNEVFCREDYRAGSDLGAVVDIGSNVGLSAMYFLSRNATSQVWCFEPLPRNVARLEQNLAAFRGRWQVEQVAVDVRSGEAEFGEEPTGRYGAIGLADARSTLPVRVKGIAELLDEVLAEVDRIDVLKIDTEGAELRTVEAIPRDQLDRIGTIYFEWLGNEKPPHPEILEATRRCDTVRLRRRPARTLVSG